jgi:nucleotide-binding universal stress UspA family protein
MKKILIGYDGSPCVNTAIEQLGDAGLPSDLDVVVMSVADVWLPSNADNPEPAFPDPLPKSLRVAREQALQAVSAALESAERAGARLRALHPGWRVKAEACADSPGWALVMKAASTHADLVVVGSHGRGLLERLFLGSVSQRVAAESVCSVRIFRDRRRSKDSPLRLLLAMDGSDDSHQALESLIARTWPESTEVRLATVVDSRQESALAWSANFGREWVGDQDRGVEEGIARRMEAWSEKLAKAGLHAETALLRGDPKHELLKAAEAWGADAIFIGARGMQHRGRPTLGATAGSIAARAHCTVEIVRSK